MKIAILSDIHWGVRQDSSIFMENTFRFLENVFYPKCEEVGSKDLIIAGDVYDKRKSVNLASLEAINRRFWPEVARRFRNVWIIAGNHDIYHDNTSRVTALDELVPFSRHIRTIVEYPEIVEIGGIEILLVPWINKQTEPACMESLKLMASDVCIGHFHCKGFEVNEGHVSEEGIDADWLVSRFKLVGSGHFHKRQEGRRFLYFGTATEFTWNDWGQTKGFHFLDTGKLRFEFVENPKKLFHRIIYDDRTYNELTVGSAMAYAFPEVKDAFVRIVVQHKAHPKILEDFVSEISKLAIDVQVIDQSALEVVKAEAGKRSFDGDTLTLLRDAIEAETNVACDKKRLEAFLLQLHYEAQLKAAR